MLRGLCSSERPLLLLSWSPHCCSTLLSASSAAAPEGSCMASGLHIWRMPRNPYSSEHLLSCCPPKSLFHVSTLFYLSRPLAVGSTCTADISLVTGSLHKSKVSPT